MDLNGKTAMITGATSGIGKSAALEIARAGASLVLPCRNIDKGLETKNWLQEETGNKQIEVIRMDLASMESIRKGASSFSSQHGRLDILINNAGIMPNDDKLRRTEDGFEQIFGINCLAPFLLTHLLYDSLARSADARVVNISSSLHNPEQKFGRPVQFDFENVNGERFYHSGVFYKNSKLAILWFTYELDRRWRDSGITVNAMCPGFVPESIAEHHTGGRKWMFKYVLARLPMATSLKKAAAMEAWMGGADELQGISGKYFEQFKPVQSSPESYDQMKAEKFWELASQKCGI
ncbi:SDR family oxidoreductase [Metabacillus indicus]|uniref:SDR family oxidoreductase n=1 Tax=Metabacillus indicus TaxID=246786 RepID=UPI003CF8F132